MWNCKNVSVVSIVIVALKAVTKNLMMWVTKPHLYALKKSARHGTPNFWHRADDFKARHSQFSTCERIGPKCNVAPVLKILGVPELTPGGSLGTGKRGTVPNI